MLMPHDLIDAKRRQDAARELARMCEGGTIEVSDDWKAEVREMKRRLAALEMVTRPLHTYGSTS